MKLLILGGGVAGIACAQAVRRLEPDCQITILSDEPYPFYSKSLLSYYLSQGMNLTALMPLSKDFYWSNKIDLEKGVAAERILPGENKVMASNGKEYFFDRLLIATGASPNFPKDKIKGLDKEGVYGLRTIADAENILKELASARDKKGAARVVIIGGGLLGLEAAVHLKQAGCEVTIAEIEKRLLTTVIDNDLSAWLEPEERFAKEGYDIRLKATPMEVLGEKKAEGLAIKEGTARKFIPADVVLVSAGVVPNAELAKGCGIGVDRGIVTDRYQQTNFPEIYAAGDVAQGLDFINGGNSLFPIWPVAAEQGKVAGKNICGRKQEYGGAVSLNSFQFFGLPVCSLGLVNDNARPGTEELTLKKKTPMAYHRVILRDGLVIGAALAGEIGNAGIIYKFIREGIAVGQRKDELVKALASPEPAWRPTMRGLY